MSMPHFTINTNRREFTVEADSVEHAERIVTGWAWPVGVPPAPRPAEKRLIPGAHAAEPTDTWLAWFAEYRPVLWGQRLDFNRETLLSIEPTIREGKA